MSSGTGRTGVVGRLYPEREEPRLGRTEHLVSTLGGLFTSWIRPGIQNFEGIVRDVHSHAAAMKNLSDHDLLEKALQNREGCTSLPPSAMNRPA
jgi:hypothetical protein